MRLFAGYQSLLRLLLAGWLPSTVAALVLAGALIFRNWHADNLTSLDFLLFAIACGVAAMIIVETIKRLLPLRSAFQRRLVATWLIERAGNADVGYLAMGELIHALGLTDDDLDRESVDGLGRQWANKAWVPRSGVDSVFNLPPEQLTGQVGQVAELPVGQIPVQYRTLMDVIARGGPPETAIPVAIDQLHVVLVGRWRHYLQATTWWLSGGIGLLASVSGVIPSRGSGVLVVAALVGGGFFAWLARDVVAVVERARR